MTDGRVVVWVGRVVLCCGLVVVVGGRLLVVGVGCAASFEVAGAVI